MLCSGSHWHVRTVKRWRTKFPVILSAISVLLLLLLLLSTPIIKTISFGSVPITIGESKRNITFGAFGYCTDKDILPPSNTNASSSALSTSNGKSTQCSEKHSLIYTLNSNIVDKLPMGKTITFLGVIYLMALCAAIIACISSALLPHKVPRFVAMGAAWCASLSTLIALFINLVFILHFKHGGRAVTQTYILMPFIAFCLLVGVGVIALLAEPQALVFDMEPVPQRPSEPRQVPESHTTSISNDQPPLSVSDSETTTISFIRSDHVYVM